jgi:sulfate adenylyltransferase
MPEVEPRRLAVNTPYGGQAVDLLLDPAEREEWVARAGKLPPIQISDRSMCDLELLALGAFAPLRRFMGRADYERVLGEMKLADGTLWPIPITLPVSADAPVELGRDVVLRSPHNEAMAVLTVEEVFAWDLERESQAVLGRFDVSHPLTAEMTRWGRRYVSGRLRVLRLPTYHDFRELRLAPSAVRSAVGAMGLPAVVAFQTRNPLHRSHEELTKRAAASCGGALLVHPAVGLTRPGDVDHYTRVRTYKALVENHYDRRRTLLSLLPLAMRMAGPREALWHAIIRRNYGATHFIVGRDHAGPGKDAAGRPFFGPYDAQELVARHATEIGVQMVPFREMVYLPDEDRYEESDRLPPTTRTLAISGTRVRNEYLAAGRPLPEWFTRKETAAILAEMSPPRHRQGFCVWLTGLSGSGKSATADVLTALLLEHGRGGGDRASRRGRPLRCHQPLPRDAHPVPGPRGQRPLPRGLRRHARRGVREPRHEGPLRQGATGRAHRLHGSGRSLRAPGIAGGGPPHRGDLGRSERAAPPPRAAGARLRPRVVTGPRPCAGSPA